MSKKTEDDRPRNKVLAICVACGTETVVAELPMEISAFAATALAATCQGCGRGASSLRLRGA